MPEREVAERTPGNVTAMPERKLGVEEELMLVDPESSQVTAVSQSAVPANEAKEEVAEELFQQQIETSTPPCLRADDLLRALREGRRAVGEAAAAAGARAVALPVPVLDDAPEDITPTPRYRKIQTEFGETSRGTLACGMHIHVEVTSDEEAVRVVDGVRPWLPLLVAIGANSPYWRGRDTGYASWRSQIWSRWPTAGAGEAFGDVSTYRAVSGRMVEWGGALDAGMLYFDVRLAQSYPTVEIRVVDVCTDVEDALLVALLVRALVSTTAVDRAAAPWRSDLLSVAGWRAARDGLSHQLVHPVEARLASPRSVFEATVDHLRPALEEAGDLEVVRDSFERLVARGNGATRQRRLFERSGSLRSVVDDLARRTEASWAGG